MAQLGEYGRRRRQLEAPTAGDSLAAWMRRYLDALTVQSYGNETLRTRRSALAIFLDWCVERELTRPGEITKPILERYQRHLFYVRKPNGQPIGPRAQRSLLNSVQFLFRWLVRNNHLPTNPAADLDLPRQPSLTLPETLTAEQAEAVLAEPNVAEVFGLRDRAVLELLYSTGLRRSEALNLSVFDVEPLRGIVRVRQGKGRKDRIVPIGERALAWVARYLNEARPALAVDTRESALFLNRWGQRYSPTGMGLIARRYIKAAGLAQRGACHLFRHSMATQMLENGADVRYIQEMLGHAKLDTTQIYTHVSIVKLQAVHAATHPAAKLKRKTVTPTQDSSDDPPPAA